MSASMNDNDQSINCDEIEELISNEEEINTASKITIQTAEKKTISSSSCVTQVQKLSLSLEKSSANNEEQVENESDNQTKKCILSVKTSNIPGPVGLLPILKTNEDLQRLKENKTAPDAILTNEENINVKRPKTSSDLFSLNISNYPSYTTALRQLQESFSCEPISIQTALVKARLGIKKRIPLMCAAVTHYDRQENTILLDNSAHIRATFIGDDELLDSFNIRVGHTLVLRNVAVFTSTRHRRHYVNIHLQNIIAIQDPLVDSFSMPIINQEYHQQKTLKLIENEITAYSDSSNTNNDTFRIFSQSDQEDEEQPPTKKCNTNNSGFNHIKSKVNASSANKFKETIAQKPSVITPPSSIAENDFDSEDLTNEFFSSW